MTGRISTGERAEAYRKWYGFDNRMPDCLKHFGTTDKENPT